MWPLGRTHLPAQTAYDGVCCACVLSALLTRKLVWPVSSFYMCLHYFQRSRRAIFIHHTSCTEKLNGRKKPFSNGAKKMLYCSYKCFCRSATNTLGKTFFRLNSALRYRSSSSRPFGRTKWIKSKVSTITCFCVWSNCVFFWRFTRLRLHQLSVKPNERFICSLPHKSIFDDDKSGVHAQPLTKERFILISMEMEFSSDANWALPNRCECWIQMMINCSIDLMKSRGNMLCHKETFLIAIGLE